MILYLRCHDPHSSDASANSTLITENVDYNLHVHFVKKYFMFIKHHSSYGKGIKQRKAKYLPK